MSFVVNTGYKQTTVYDIVMGALRLIGASSPDVTIGEDEANEALSALNMMLDSFSNESLILHRITQETFSLTPGQSSFSIGYGGDFDTERPLSIEQATFNISGVDTPVNILNYDDWSAIELKTLQTNVPQYLYLDDTYPLSTLHIYPSIQS